MVSQRRLFSFIILTDHFLFNSFLDETLEFTVSNDSSSQSVNNELESQESDVEEESLTNTDRRDVSNLGSEETLIYREIEGIKIAPGQGKIPMPVYKDLFAEELSFPTIFAGIRRKFKINLSYTDIAKSELQRYDRRACAPTKLLYSFKRSFNDKVRQAVQVFMRKKVGTSHVTASQTRTPGFVENLIKKDEGYAVFKNLRSSPSYWQDKTKKVMGMMRQIGKCSFFITFSAAESKWTELLVSKKRQRRPNFIYQIYM
jgi:hypothetical protein